MIANNDSSNGEEKRDRKKGQGKATTFPYIIAIIHKTC